MKLIKSTRVSYKCRIEIDYETERFILGQLECNRICYNKMLEKYLKDRDNQIKNHIEGEPYEKISINYTWIKEENPWMYDYIGDSLDYVVKNLHEALSNWFKNYDPKNPAFCRPQFKKKWRYITASFKLRARVFKILPNNEIILNKLKDHTIKVINHRNLDLTKTKTLTIVRHPSNTYYAVFSFETSDLRTIDIIENNDTIAIDLGIKNYFTYIDSNGNYGTVENPKIYKESEKRKALLDKRLSRKRRAHKKLHPEDRYGQHNEEDYPYSKRYQKTRRQKAALSEHTARARNYFLNNLTTNIVKNYNKIIIEDIRVKELVQKTNDEFKNKSKKARHNINKATYDVGWYIFRQMLEYKCKWNNRELIIADKEFPSTQMCSSCGYINEKLKDVKIREWICPECNAKHDRDLNACQNLLNKYI